MRRAARASFGRLALAVLVVTSLVAAACSGDKGSGEAASTVKGLVVQTQGVPTSLDRRLLGTNLPAWAKPDKLADADFRAAVVASGTTVVRMPGGSWADAYDWLACERGDSATCFWTWAARPTDFLEFLKATGIAGMWTVSFNETAQEAAALVAFFNGRVDDHSVIGVDRHGVDWKTVGDWAALRTADGNPDPVPIPFWEVGNETYGAKQENGPDCASFGWEDVWTCDGDAYVHGDANHDGFLDFSKAMKAVDPSITIGAVGVPEQKSWTNWGTKVIHGAGDVLDFYSVHNYAFSATPLATDVLAAPQRMWSNVVEDVQATAKQQAVGRTLPVAVTEYNIVAFQDADNNRLMIKAAGALFDADTIGQLASHGVVMANQYNLVNGKAANGTDYGLLDIDTNARNPQYYALKLWSLFGNQLLPMASEFPSTSTLSAYAGRDDAGVISVLAINKTDQPISTTVNLDGTAAPMSVSVDSMTAESLDATDVVYDGVTAAGDSLAARAPASLGVVSGPLTHEFPKYSITLIRWTPVAA